MNDTLPPTSYVSRVIALPPGVAQQVFDACRVDRQYRSAVPSRWTVPAGPSIRLELDGPGHTVAPDPTRSWALRACRGVLRSNRLVGPFDVELELNPWSGARSEIGLRLVGRKRPSARYLAAAGAVVDGLASELELRGLLALHPDHTTGFRVRQQEATASAWL
ncbi:MAG: hypothetical protein JWO68_2237 [Actinomycetia bacterium]|nr:hypothetical protein [Actinomycetes bacterium]